MGDHDAKIIDIYSNYMAEKLDYSKIKSIAWLGWQEKSNIAKFIESKCTNLQRSVLFDIEDSKGATKWDINGHWNISNFDLVICFRTTPFVQNSQHFVRQLSMTVKNNKHVFVDFLLPSLFFLRDAIMPLREDLRKIVGEKCEAIVSWGEPVSLFEFLGKADADKSSYIYKHTKEGNYEKPFLKASHTLAYDKQTPYSMLPHFPSLYEKVFYATTGYHYERDKVDYFPNEGTVLSEKQLKTSGLFLSDVKFYYMHDYRPLQPNNSELWNKGKYTSKELKPWSEDKHTFFICKVEGGLV